MANVFKPEWSEQEGDGRKRARVGRQAGTERIGISLSPARWSRSLAGRPGRTR